MSRAPVLLGADGQPIGKSFKRVSATKNADGSVTVPRSKLPVISEEIFRSFIQSVMEQTDSAESVEGELAKDNPVVFLLLQNFEANIDKAIHPFKDARGNAIAKTIARESMYSLYRLLSLQLAHNKAVEIQEQMKKEESDAISTEKDAIR